MQLRPSPPRMKARVDVRQPLEPRRQWPFEDDDGMNAPSARHVSSRNMAPAEVPADAYQSSLGLDVLITGDLLRTSDILPGDPTDDCSVFDDDATGAEDHGLAMPDPDTEFGEGRRGYGRYRLANNFIRVQVYRDDGKPSLGRMTNASVTGLFVRCQSPLAFRTTVRVTWSMTNDVKMEFTGRVVRTTRNGMAIHLTTDDANWRYRASFIDMCRTPSQTPPSVVVRKVSAAEAQRHREDDDVLRRLGAQWRRVEEQFAADDRHQAFIQTCLREKRLQFALERYRELQAHPIDGFDPTPYLKQIGTILSFYQLQPRSSGLGPSPLRRYLPIAIVTMLLLGLLSFIPYLTRAPVTPHP